MKNTTKIILFLRKARILAVLFAAAVSPVAVENAVAAPWEVRTDSNPLDDEGEINISASGDSVSPIPGHGAAFPYEDLQAKLLYQCYYVKSDTGIFFSSVDSSYYIRMAILFSQKPNVRKQVLSGGFVLTNFRVKGDSDETRNFSMHDTHVYGFSFGGIVRWDEVSSLNPFSTPWEEFVFAKHVFPYDSIIVGVPWANDGEVLFKFHITPEMKAAVAEVDAACARLNAENEKDGERKQKREPFSGNSGGNK